MKTNQTILLTGDQDQNTQLTKTTKSKRNWRKNSEPTQYLIKWYKTFGTKMSGEKNGRGRILSRGGRGRGRESDRWNNYSVATPNHTVLCTALGKHVFDCGQKASAYQMCNTWENLVHNSVTIHGNDIINELQNKKTVIIFQSGSHTNYIGWIQIGHQKKVPIIPAPIRNAAVPEDCTWRPNHRRRSFHIW